MPSSWRWCAVLFALNVVGYQCLAQIRRGCPPQEAILPCRCLLRGGAEYQIWCSHSDLPRVLQGLKSVGQHIFQPIDELILENNNLPSLPGRAFLPLQIMRLMLRHNGLERVSSGWLSGQEKTIMELFVVEPSLRSLPEDSMGALTALEAVTIQSEVMKHLPNFSRLPKLRYLQVDSAALTELSPMSFQQLSSLEKFHISGSSLLTRLESGLLRDMPALTLVNISNCGVSWVHPRSITRLPVLTELSLVGNKIMDAGMVGRAVTDLPSLNILRLDRNLIDVIDEGAFVGLNELSELYVSNNRITELHRGAFHRLPMLRILHLNNNLIRRVHPETFVQRTGNGLEELSLINNDISHIAELRSLLDALPRLTFLDMSYNHLEAIPFGALRGHPTLERLHLDHNRLHLVAREAFMAMPALRELRLKNNSLSDLIEGPLWNLPELKGLDLSGNFYKRVEPRLLDNLPSLRRIDLSGNEITIVDPVVFIRTPALEHVNLSHNMLPMLHPATFRALHNLYELDVSYNRLMDFVPGLPRGIEYLHMSHNIMHIFPHPPSPDLDLPALRYLDIAGNGIQRIAPGAMRTLPQLRRLFASKNSLQYLEDKSLDGLSRLEVLDLHDNRIVQLHPSSLTDLPELHKLNLRENRLNALEPRMLENLLRLEQLDLARNKLTEIKPGTFEKTRDLQHIDASHNALSELPLSLYGLKRLRVLDLSNNRVRTISPEVLNTLTSLRDLRLSHNLLQELKKGAINDLQNMKTLHLDNNALEIVQPNAIRALPLLKVLKLNQNKLTEIPNSAFSNLPSLETAELQENMLRHVAVNAFNLVPHILMLNLSHNQLPGFDDAGLRNMRSLEMLDISNNRINRLTTTSLEKMEWLIELRVDNNQICAIHGTPFDGMPRLRVLSMKNNKMMTFPERAVQKLRGNLAMLDIDGNPLACTCSLMWMRGWLQESVLFGPRCVDGTLLRDSRLTRQQCSDAELASEPVAPGCEAELLTAPGPYGTSQIFSPFMNLKELPSKKTTGGKNNVAPSPQESEYFYDDYVDYPYNESITTNGNVKSKPESTTGRPSVQQTTKSSHYVPGDTPTIYAATKDKTKVQNNTNKNVTKSPGSSGFTFFGVPLPSLNLNSLLGGTGRKEDHTPDAERKAGIVTTTRGSGRGSVYPPTVPEIQTGGFVPVIPGSGGFQPIPNPTLEMPPGSNMSVNIEMLNVTRSWPPQNSTEPANVSPATISHSTNTYIMRKSSYSSMGHPVPTPPPEIRVTTEYNANEASTVAKLHTKVVTHPPQPQTSTPHTLGQVIKPINTTYNRNVSKLHLNGFTNSEAYANTFKQYATNMPPSTTPRPEEIVSTKDSTHVIAVSESSKEEITEQPKKENAATPLTSLLAPGGQPNYRPPGRSIITKVTSPHASATAPLLSSMQVADDVFPSPYKEEIITEGTMSNMEKGESDTSWYFMNYNKTNLEPYIGNVYSKECSSFNHFSKVEVVLLFICVYAFI